jgi:predicted anti-sigma-YlaC factor YlaD
VFSCDEFMAELGNYLDDQVAMELRRQLDEHLGHCRTCQVVYDSARKTLRIVTDSQVFDVPPGVSESLVSRIMSRIRSGETEHSPD